MSNLPQQLKKFERRVRYMRAWRGLAIGACIGGVLASAWAILDWTGVYYTEWRNLGIVLGSCALLGLIVGFARRVSPKALADSIDRRAKLEDRLATALERSDQSGSFDEPLQSDAESQLGKMNPRSVFPVRVGRWQASAVAITAVAASLFLLGNTPILLNSAKKKEQEEIKKLGAAVERVAKPLTDPDNPDALSEKEKQLANELEKFKRDLEKARMSKPEAFQKANELAKKADELMKERAEKTEQSLAKAETALQKLQRSELESQGHNLGEMGDMSPSELQAQISQLQAQIDSLNQQINALQQALQNPNLSDEERAEMQAQLEQLKDELEQASYSLKLSKEAKELFERIANHPIYKEIQEMMRQMQQNSQSAMQQGQTTLTKEQIEEMQKRLDELAKKLKGDKELEEFLKAMKEALQNAGGT